MFEGIFENLVTPEMAGLATSAVAVMLFVGRIPVKTKRLNQTKVWSRWGIFILFGVCVAGSFVPGVHNIPSGQWGSVLVFALLSSMVALLGRAILKPLIIEKLEGKNPKD